MPAFSRHIGIDYSGAETPTSSLKGLRVYLAEGQASPETWREAVVKQLLTPPVPIANPIRLVNSSESGEAAAR
jgi:hypothetical protein